MSADSGTRRGIRRSRPASTALATVLSPRQVQERFQHGTRWSLVAACSVFLSFPMLLPFVGVVVGVWAIRKARSYGNPAVLGVVAVILNGFATFVWVRTALQLWAATH